MKKFITILSIISTFSFIGCYKKETVGPGLPSPKKSDDSTKIKTVDPSIFGILPKESSTNKRSANGMPIYRYFNVNRGVHFYTQNAYELLGGGNGWLYEGVAFYLEPITGQQTNGLTNVFRFFNAPTGVHYYSTYVNAPPYFDYEGAIGAAYKQPFPGSTSVYIYTRSGYLWGTFQVLDYFYGTDNSEGTRNSLSKYGYYYGGVAFFINN